MAGFHKIAEDLLKTFGFVLDVSNFTNDHFDIEAGSNVKILDKTEKGLGAFIQLDSGMLKENGYIYYEGDKQILLSVPLSFNVDISTVIKILNIDYKIGFISEVKDVLETAIYKVVIRENKEV